MNGKNIALLLLGRTCSKFASSFYLIVLPLYLLDSTQGDTAKAGQFFLLAGVPAVLITPFIGIIIENINRKYSIIGCDLATAVLYFILGMMSITGERGFVSLLLISIVINMLANAFEISSKVLFTELTTPETIERYNGIKSFCDNAAMITAPACGAFVYSIVGFETILLIVSAAYALSAIQEVFLKYEFKKLKSEAGAAKQRWTVQMRDAGIYVYKNKDILALFTLVMSLNFFVGNDSEIIFPSILVNKYAITEKLYGFSQSALVLGTLTAGLFIFRNKKRNLIGNFKYLLILNSLFMMGIGVCSVIMYPNRSLYYMAFIVLLFMAGFTGTCINVPLASYFQTRVPLAYQGRFFSMLTFAAQLLVPMGIGFAGAVVVEVPADIAYIVFNAAIILIVLIAMRKTSKISEMFQS